MTDHRAPGTPQRTPVPPAAPALALPTPVRMHADPRFTGAGVTIAFVDSDFAPHPDLAEPVNRIRAYADARLDGVPAWCFGPDDQPRWPGWDRGRDVQWHGTMTTCVAAGNGRLSGGLFRGLACAADVVLVATSTDRGRVTNDTIERALRWLADHAAELSLDVVNISVGGDPVAQLKGNAIDRAVDDLVTAGVVVVAAAGNDPRRQLLPPATARAGVVVGGVDDAASFDDDARRLWHSSYGVSEADTAKPELIAPSIWVVAPVLPFSAIAREAPGLFARRAAGDAAAAERIAALKLVTPAYQHVEGTSFAAPIVAATAACMLEANPRLTPTDVRAILTSTASLLPEAPPERQGAGVAQPGPAVAEALRR